MNLNAITLNRVVLSDAVTLPKNETTYPKTDPRKMLLKGALKWCQHLQEESDFVEDELDQFTNQLIAKEENSQKNNIHRNIYLISAITVPLLIAVSLIAFKLLRI